VVQGNSSQLAEGVREGDVIDGKYRVDRVLGAGAMGIVVAAHHLHLDRRVAIKFLMPRMRDEPEALARFTREARAAAKIRSEHIAQVLDVGTLENGAPYMVMEFLDGSDLAEWLRARGPLPFGEAVEFILQACEAIAEAHTLGIVHRDLKPANLFCTRSPDGLLCVKVLDFGISKLGDLPGASPEMAMTSTSAVMGTPYYMSPEQLRASRDVDPRTDIWALGVILYELTTGQVPFKGESLSDVCIKIAMQPTPSLRALRPEAPEGLDAAMGRCLEKDRERRYSTVAEFALAIAAYAPDRARASVDRISRMLGGSGRSEGATLWETLPVSAEDFKGGTFGPLGRTSAGTKGRRTAALALIVLVAGVTTIGVLSATLLTNDRIRPGSTEVPVGSRSARDVLPMKIPAATSEVPEEHAGPATVATTADLPGPAVQPVQATRNRGAGSNQAEQRPKKPTPRAPQAARPPAPDDSVLAPPAPSSPPDDADPFSKLTPK
jgi:tRNA A-37 threonylcarbamoyl transferase component Bud32